MTGKKIFLKRCMYESLNWYPWTISVINWSNSKFWQKTFLGQLIWHLNWLLCQWIVFQFGFFSWFYFFVTLSFLNYYYYIQRYSYSIYKRTDLVVAVDKKVVCHMAATKQLFNQFSTVVKGKGLCWCSSLWSPITIHSHVWPT